MSTLRTTPAPARTDVSATPAAAMATAPEPQAGVARLRACGAGATIGAVTYGVAFIMTGGTASFVIALTGLVFQLGVFALLAAMWMTRATGTSRLARGMLVAESVVLGVATVQSVLTLPAGDGAWSPLAQVIDPFWPLSMLGMAIIGVKVAVAGRWRGALRVWPVVAETWIFVALPAMMLGPVIGGVVAGGHFIVGYGVLGLLLAVRPDLTGRV